MHRSEGGELTPALYMTQHRANHLFLPPLHLALYTNVPDAAHHRKSRKFLFTLLHTGDRMTGAASMLLKALAISLQCILPSLQKMSLSTSNGHSGEWLKAVLMPLCGRT